jgi:hypothetical protein
MAAVDKLRRWQHLPVLDDPPSSHGGEVEEAEYDASDEPSDSEPGWRALPLPHGRRRSTAVAEEALRYSTLPPSLSPFLFSARTNNNHLGPISHHNLGCSLSMPGFQEMEETYIFALVFQ